MAQKNDDVIQTTLLEVVLVLMFVFVLALGQHQEGLNKEKQGLEQIEQIETKPKGPPKESDETLLASSLPTNTMVENDTLTGNEHTSVSDAPKPTSTPRPAEQSQEPLKDQRPSAQSRGTTHQRITPPISQDAIVIASAEWHQRICVEKRPLLIITVAPDHYNHTYSFVIRYSNWALEDSRAVTLTADKLHLYKVSYNVWTMPDPQIGGLITRVKQLRDVFGEAISHSTLHSGWNADCLLSADYVWASPKMPNDRNLVAMETALPPRRIIECNTFSGLFSENRRNTCVTEAIEELENEPVPPLKPTQPYPPTTRTPT